MIFVGWRQIYTKIAFITTRTYLQQCGTFAKHRTRIKKFRETGNLKHIYKNELDKACFSHYAAYSDSNDLDKRTVSDRILKDEAYDIAINPNYNE